MKAWTIKTASGRALVYADTRKQAAAIYSKGNPGRKITGVAPNYHAQNMHPRPADFSEFIARGGGQ